MRAAALSVVALIVGCGTPGAPEATKRSRPSPSTEPPGAGAPANPQEDSAPRRFGLTYTERVTITFGDDPRGRFPNVWAFRRELEHPSYRGEKRLHFEISVADGGVAPRAGAIITDKFGNEYEVTQVAADTLAMVRPVKK